jgi:hypothetical protein
VRTIVRIIGLEAYAIILALLHGLGGVRTDEAKYLLNIPYPHPPFLRSAMSFTESIPFQDTLLRILLATLFIQSVWFVWDMSCLFCTRERLAASAAWLFSAGIILYTGSVLLAPVNAVEGLILLWFLSRPDIVRTYPLIPSLFWLASLFTGYQAVLYLPIAVAMFYRAEFRIRDVLLFSIGPFLLLILYTLSSPIIMASILHHGGEDLDSSLAYRAFHTVRLWMIGGSGIVSAIGTVGIIRSRRWELILSFLFVFCFIILNWFEYYSPLFVPLLVAGVISLFAKRSLSPHITYVLVPVSIVFVMAFSYSMPPSTARVVMHRVNQTIKPGDEILIQGSFGHEWQYESRNPILRFKPEFVAESAAVICLNDCLGMKSRQGWELINGLPIEVYIKR